MLNKDSTIEISIISEDEEITEENDSESTKKTKSQEEEDEIEFGSHQHIQKMKPSELKISKEEVDELMEEYQESNYNYYHTARPFIKKMIERGLEPPNTKIKDLPLMYTLYLECIWNIFKISLIFCIAQAIPIYLTALFGLKLEFFSIMLSHKFYYFIVTPYNFVYQTKLYHILEHFLSPLIVILMSFLFVRAINDFEDRMVDEIDRSQKRNSMHCVRLKNLEFKTEEELSSQVDLIMERVVDKDVVLIKDSNLIEKKMNDYFNLEIELRQFRIDAEGKESKPNFKKKIKELKKKRFDLVAEIKNTNKKLIRNCLELQSAYGFVCFYSYRDMQEFRKNLPEKKKTLPKMTRVQALHAPEPYDINWNYYARSYEVQGYSLHAVMVLLFWVISPAVTYFCEKELSYGLARAFLTVSGNEKKISEGIIEGTYSFMLVRVLASSCYALVCSLAIDKYYERRIFKTYSANIRSKFYFYNTYFLLNQIVADFYGIIGAVIKDLDQGKSQSILIGYSNYIFSAALKVGLMLCFSPFLLKFVDFIPKIINKLKVKFSFGSPLNLHKVKADLPVEHNIDVMASFVVQSVFFLGFFESFMMPILSMLIIIGLFVFYHFESYMLKNYQARNISLSLNQVKMIYTLSYFGFLAIQPLAIGNVNLVLSYFDSLNLKSLRSLIASSLDYTILVILIIFGMFITYHFRETAIKERIAQKLVKKSLDREGEVEEKRVKDGMPYESRNPLFKAKCGIYKARLGD